MDALNFLQDLTVVLISAAAVLLLFKRFKQPPVLGYLAVGLLIGPHTAAVELVSDFRSLEALAQIGVVFLLFALGVEFNLKRLAKVGWRAMFVAGIEMTLIAGLGYVAGVAFGMRPMGALLLGAVISLASTAITARAILEHNGNKAGWGELAGGALIAEDILAVLLIAFFSSAGQLGDFQLADLFSQLFRFGMLVTVILVAGLLLLPGVLQLVERSGMKEVRTLVIVGTCFGVSFLTEWLGFSAALGAFLAGAMMSETAAATRLRDTVEPFKDVFGAVFFTAVGTMIDPSWIFGNWQLALSVVLLVALGRFLANFIALAGVGEDKKHIVPASLARMPIGEFSFILAQVGDQHGFVDVPLYPLSVLLCIGTTFVSASMMPAAHTHAERIDKMFPRWLDSFLTEYRSSVKRLSMPKRMQLLLELIKPSLMQIVLILMGLSGLFLAANWIQRRFDFEPLIPGALWVLTAFLTLPFLLALWRKAQAVTLILLEEITTRGDDPRPPAETHPTMTRFLLGMTTVMVAWWYLSVSLTLLPPWPYALIPLGIMLLMGAFLWRQMNKLYARIQVNLRETLQKGHADPEASATLVSHLVEAQSAARVIVSGHRIKKNSGAAGTAIRDLAIRSSTGASIVQINRSGESNTSPGPETHLHVGDEVLLIGEKAQTEAAKHLLDRATT
jgi:CPA2 family monovalent cation:H+ antiporter-2